ncbi:uncharacterized protein [Rutidosis leptorrhynchoides]|uniref:uncharacterized protein n=1 Tax=Rutidosis leptorrhynchoides TaxID=125765 RepID=UPI003A9A4BEB
MGEKDDTKKEAQVDKVVDVDNVTKNVEEVGPITIILKLDLHCGGCAKKVQKSVRCIQGVESVKADSVSNRLTVIGKLDPTHIKERVEFKTKKKVEIISPKPKKDDGGVKKGDDKPAETKSNDQKLMEPVPSTMAVLKIPLHCDGCIQKIKRIILKIDGVESVKPDSSKNWVTVKGTMNMKELIPYLKDKLKRNVDVVPPKIEDNKGGEKKDEKKIEVNTDDKDEKKENDHDKDTKNDVQKATEDLVTDVKNKKTEDHVTDDVKNKKTDDQMKITSRDNGDVSENVDVMNKSEYYRNNDNSSYIYTLPVYNQSFHNQDYGVPVFSSNGYGNGDYGYAVGYSRGPPPPPSPMSIHNPHASEPDMFSDENPNGCSIM